FKAASQSCKIDSAERDMLVRWFMAVSARTGAVADVLKQLPHRYKHKPAEREREGERL
ncbi:hypothetical protein CRENBAI_023799, partial [Crenichthys baileyi]